MRTSDFTSKPSSTVMNETLNKKFGEKLDIENYSDSQLEKAASLIESRIAVLKKGKFNETLNSEEFHRLKLMQDIVKTAISERAVNPYAVGMAAAKKQAGYGKKPAHDLPKKVVKKGHEIAKSIKKTDESTKIKDEGNAFGKAVRDAKKDGIQKGEKIKVGGKTYPVKEAAKPDYIDLDKDGNKKEPMKKAAQDAKKHKKTDEGMQDLYKNYIDKKGAEMEKHKKGGYTKTGKEKKSGEKARDAGRATADKMYKASKKLKESVMQESVMKSISRLLREGEESKAELIMAVKDMVDKFTGWSEDIAQMQAQTAMEMADAIRDELGADQAEAFTASVQPALDAAFQSVKGAREALNGSVASLTGVAPTPMGAEPGMDAGMDMDVGMEPGAELDADMEIGDEVPGDEAEMDMDADVAAPVDRAKRESIEHRLRLTKLLVGR